MAKRIKIEFVNNPSAGTNIGFQVTYGANSNFKGVTLGTSVSIGSSEFDTAFNLYNWYLLPGQFSAWQTAIQTITLAGNIIYFDFDVEDESNLSFPVLDSSSANVLITESNTTLVLQWSNAFDIDNNIVGYELSYQTTGSWISLPFITSSQTSGSYSFSPTQQVNHSFRIRIRDSFGAVSPYKYFNYTVSALAEYQISSVWYSNTQDPDNDERDTCQIVSEPTNTYTNIYLSSEPPTTNVIVYTNPARTTLFNGMRDGTNQYWIIKSPSGLFYSCLINSLGAILAVYLCGGNSANISSGRNTANLTCDLQLPNNVYWKSEDSFEVGTKLYTNSTCTEPFLGNGRFYSVEYVDPSTSSTLTNIVQIGNLVDISIIVSIVPKSSVCSLVSLAYRSSGTFNMNQVCSLNTDIACYVRHSEPSSISNGDIVYTNSEGTSIFTEDTFSGPNRFYIIYLALAALGGGQYIAPSDYAICTINNLGEITVIGYCGSFNENNQNNFNI